MSIHELEVQRHLRAGNSPESLKGRYAVGCSRHPKYDNLVHLKYDHINANWGDEIARECRGLILDEASDFTVVARPFNKFFNHGEPNAADIHWPSATVDEKLDGSLCVMYFYAGNWHVATTGTPDGGGEVSGFDFTFHDLFFKTLGSMRPHHDRPPMTYLFELMSPYNRIVVDHKESHVKLLGQRCNWDGEFSKGHSYEWVDNKMPDSVRSFTLSSTDGILSTFKDMDPLKQEGYVIWDENGNRIKVKHPGYVAIHHVVFGLSERRMVDIILDNEVPEVVASFPALKDHMDTIKLKIDSFCDNARTAFDNIRTIEDQKAFALEAMKTKFSSVLFMMRQTPDESLYRLLRRMTTKRVMQLCGIREIVKKESIES